MEEVSRTYIAIDLKSFYASVECVERGLDPLDACLVVADRSRTDKTICLAVTPALKSYGTGGRPRLFEVVQRVREANRTRGGRSSSVFQSRLDADPTLRLDFIVAPPRMSLYLAYSTRIYGIYLRYVAPEDIHVYSVDEVFIDATPYLGLYGATPHDFAMTMIRDVLRQTGITATAGIGSNMYLAKVAMDIVAKKMAPDSDGVRIASLDETSYRRQLWDHRPLTDFWRVGPGTARRLAVYGIFTMGDIARASHEGEALLYRLFGVNAEFLIDHAWGWEPVTMAQVKAYRPASSSLSHSQVLHTPYSCAQARTVMLEMAEQIAFGLSGRGLLTGRISVSVGYDIVNLTDPAISSVYDGPVASDHYGRPAPVSSKGSMATGEMTSSVTKISGCVAALFDAVADSRLLVRRLGICASGVVTEEEQRRRARPEQLQLWVDYDEQRRRLREQREHDLLERRRQEAVLRIRRRYGKNAILRGLNFAEGATQRERNGQIGGHKA